MCPNCPLKSSGWLLQVAQKQPHQEPPTQVASRYDHYPEMVSCMDVKCLNKISCTQQSSSQYQILQSQHMIKIMQEAVIGLMSGCHGRWKIMCMSKDDLDVTKLERHPLRQISDHMRFVSEPSRAKTDSLKQTYLAGLLIWVHDNRTKIHVMHMRSYMICHSLTLWGNKHRGTGWWSSLYLPQKSLALTDLKS